MRTGRTESDSYNVARMIKQGCLLACNPEAAQRSKQNKVRRDRALVCLVQERERRGELPLRILAAEQVMQLDCSDQSSDLKFRTRLILEMTLALHAPCDSAYFVVHEKIEAALGFTSYFFLLQRISFSSKQRVGSRGRVIRASFQWQVANFSSKYPSWPKGNTPQPHQPALGTPTFPS